MAAALQGHLFAGGRAADPLHYAFLSRGRLPQHTSDRDGGGRDHVEWWLEDGVDDKVAISSRQVQGGKRNCGQSYAGVSDLPLSPRVREMMEAILRKFG